MSPAVRVRQIRLVAKIPTLTGGPPPPGSPPKFTLNSLVVRTGALVLSLSSRGARNWSHNLLEFLAPGETSLLEAFLSGSPCSYQGLRVATALGLDPGPGAGPGGNPESTFG